MKITVFTSNQLRHINLINLISEFADETFDKEFMDFKLLQRDNWCLTTEETLNHEFLHNHKKLYFYAKILNTTFEVDFLKFILTIIHPPYPPA